MRKAILVCLIFIIILITCCGLIAEEIDEDTNVSTAINQESESPATLMRASFEPVDKTFENVTTSISSLIEANNRVYYTAGRMLYCYNIDTGKKTEIADDLIVANIHLVDGYVYFAREKNIMRINIQTNEAEVYYSAEEIVRKLYDRQWGWIKTSEKIRRFVIYKNGFLEADITYETWHNKQKGDYYVSPLINIFTGEMVNMTTAMPSEPLPENFNLYYDEKSGTFTTTLFLRVLNDDGSIETLFSLSPCALLFITDTRWPSSCLSVAIYNFESDEIIYQRDVDGALAVPNAFGQYLFIYYYDRMHSEQVDAKKGMVLYDAKNDVIYENEEINQIISGDIDYTRLYHTDFYLSGDTLYVLENNVNEIPVKGLSYDEKEAYLKSGLQVHDEIYSSDEYTYETGDVIDMPSEVNIYKAEVIDGKLHFTLLYQEFTPEE